MGALTAGAPSAQPAPEAGKTVTIVANLRRESIDDLISTLESLDTVGGRHLAITVRDGFEIAGVPEQVAGRLTALLSELGVEHYTLERAPIHLTGCHHLFDCPRDLVGTEALTAQLGAVIDESGVEGTLLDSVNGHVDPRGRLKVAVAGCTSCCNAPQVQDFGVVAKAHPKRAEVPCQDGCRACVEVCEDAAVVLTDGRPVIAQSKCTDCGQCIRVCPTGTLVAEKSGFEIFEGGRLGRDPRVGTRAQEWATFDEVRARLKKALGDIAYCLEPAAGAPVVVKPDGVSVAAPHVAKAQGAGATHHVLEPPRLRPRD